MEKNLFSSESEVLIPYLRLKMLWTFEKMFDADNTEFSSSLNLILKLYVEHRLISSCLILVERAYELFCFQNKKMLQSIHNWPSQNWATLSFYLKKKLRVDRKEETHGFHKTYSSSAHTASISVRLGCSITRRLPAFVEQKRTIWVEFIPI